MKRKKWFNVLLRIISFILITVVFLLATLFLTLKLMCGNISLSARELFVTTMLETGQMKFVPSLFLSKSEIEEIVKKNTMEDISEEENLDLIDVSKDNIDGIRIEKIEGSTFLAKMIIINDPSRVSLTTTFPWTEYGVELHELVKKNDSFAAVNGGLYQSAGNKGGYPLGVVVSNNEIQYNRPNLRGLHLIGLDQNNLLRILSLEGMNSTQVEQLIKTEKIRDAVTFQEASSYDTNHFVKLVVNGEKREIKGKGSGANPRTAIGQRKDGAILLLVTDGRGSNGHMGATASDLIDIMMKYGAVNAANLDGGSSSSMYYDDKYEMTSVTLYYSNSSWRLPNAFVVEKR